MVVHGHPVPTSGGAAANEHVTMLGDDIDKRVESAGRRRERKQNYNNKQARRIGRPRAIKIGDYVFVHNNSKTQPTALQNKQKQSGPYQVVHIDSRSMRARLRRPADNVELDTPFAINRLQRVSDEAVTTVIPPTDESDAGWNGVTDTRYLLDAERQSVDKSKLQQAEQQRADEAKRQRAAEAEAAKLELQRVRRQQQAAARTREQKRLDDERERNRQLQLQRASVVVSNDVVPTGIMPHVTGELLIVPMPDGSTVHVGPQHRRYRDLQQRYRAQLTIAKQQERRRQQNADRLRRFQRKARA